MNDAYKFAQVVIDLIPGTLSLSNATKLLYEAEKLAAADYAFAKNLKPIRTTLLAINDSNVHAWPKTLNFGGQVMKVDNQLEALATVRGVLADEIAAMG